MQTTINPLSLCKKNSSIYQQKRTERIGSNRAVLMQTCAVLIDLKIHLFFSLLFIQHQMYKKNKRKFFQCPIVVSGVKVLTVCCRHSLATNDVENGVKDEKRLH
jgi:hypothetical protein